MFFLVLWFHNHNLTSGRLGRLGTYSTFERLTFCS